MPGEQPKEGSSVRRPAGLSLDSEYGDNQTTSRRTPKGIGRILRQGTKNGPFEKEANRIWFISRGYTNTLLLWLRNRNSYSTENPCLVFLAAANDNR